MEKTINNFKEPIDEIISSKEKISFDDNLPDIWEGIDVSNNTQNN